MRRNGTITDLDPIIVVTGFDDALELWEALMAHYLERRRRGTGAIGVYPETSVLDVHQVAGVFSAELDALPSDALGRSGTVARWRRSLLDVQRLTAGRLTGELYPDNERFWRRDTRSLAIDLSAARELPTKREIVLDAVKSAAVMPVSFLPSGVGNVLGGVADTVGGVIDKGGDVLQEGADAVGGAADVVIGKAGELLDAVDPRQIAGDFKEGAKDLAKDVKEGVKDVVGGLADAIVTPLVDALGKPVLIGAAVVGGVLIVPKLLDERKGRRAA